jgi:hypothetical protein
MHSAATTTRLHCSWAYEVAIRHERSCVRVDIFLRESYTCVIISVYVW